MKLRLSGWMLAGLGLLLAGCELFDPVLKNSRSLFEQGRGEESLALLEKAAAEKPGQYSYRSEYFRQRDLLAARWLAQADALQLAGQPDMAGNLYRTVLKHDSANARARAGLVQVDAEKRHRSLIASADKLVKQEKYTEADDVLRPVLSENPQNREARRLQRLIEDKTVKPASTPQLIAAARKPLTLELRDVPLRAVFDVISRGIGVNFVFDKDVRTDQRTSLAMQDAAAEEVVRLVLATNQLEQKIINERTVLIFPNTPQKLREYQELVVKSFYLANADVKQTANMIRTLVKTRDIFVDERLNLLIIKDSPAAVRIAERLIAAQDLAEPEVMLEVEVLEVGTSRLLELGVRFPESLAVSLVGGGTTTTTGTTTGGTTTVTTGTSGTPGTISLTEWLNRSSSLVSLTFTNPLFLFTLRQQDGSTAVLANPRIRVRNKTKARIHIGDRVPVITTTAAAAGGFISESVTYLDVGLKLEVEPLIHLEDEVDINIGLEVSNIAREVRSATSNTLTYQIGTRNAATALRLRDGETQVLAGLISDEDRRAANRVPGVGDLAVVGRLFSATRDTTAKTEIVLLITPRLVRTLARPEARSLEFAAGTDALTGAPSASSPFVLPPLQPAATPAARPTVPSTIPSPFTIQPTAPVPPPTMTPPGFGAIPSPAAAPAPTTSAPITVPFGGVQPEPPR